MKAIEQIACAKGRRDEVPDRELARALARTRDTVGIAEIAAGLHPNTIGCRVRTQRQGEITWRPQARMARVVQGLPQRIAWRCLDILPGFERTRVEGIGR